MDCNNGVPSQTSTLSRAEKALVKRNVSRPALSNNTYSHTSLTNFFHFSLLRNSFLSYSRPDPQFCEDSATEDHAKSKKAKNQPRG